MGLTANDQEADPTDELDSVAAFAAWHYKQDGEEFFRKLLEHDGDSPFSYESLSDVADELTRAGMHKPAKIAAEIAATKPSMTDIEAFCPYARSPYVGNPGNERNIEAWLAAQQRRKLKWKLKRKGKWPAK